MQQPIPIPIAISRPPNPCNIPPKLGYLPGILCHGEDLAAEGIRTDAQAVAVYADELVAFEEVVVCLLVDLAVCDEDGGGIGVRVRGEVDAVAFMVGGPGAEEGVVDDLAELEWEGQETYVI